VADPANQHRVGVYGHSFGGYTSARAILTGRMWDYFVTHLLGAQ